MKQINRRDFVKLMGISAASAVTPGVIRKAGASVAPRVVVVGSGFAGSTVAKYLRIWSQNEIDVTVVDPKSAHTSCIMSNLVVNERLNLADITFDHAILAEKYGVEFVQDSVINVSSNISEKIVSLQHGRDLYCDVVVLAPGISLDAVPGLDSNKVPHAWIAGPQTELLRDQLKEIPAGGTFVMTVPKKPYRCPPGPYERACVVADIVKRKGGGKVIVLDLNDGITVEEPLFSSVFNGIYAGIVEYHSDVVINFVDSDNLRIETNIGTFDADVMNIIPTHRSGRIITDLGLNSISGRWADVDPISYESRDQAGIYVIGDSGGTNQPKSGHMANSQAKICADAIIRQIANQPIDTIERLSNLTTNSACYSPITYSTATWLTAGFKYDLDSNSMKVVPESKGEAELHNKDHYKDMFSWAENLFENTFF